MHDNKIIKYHTILIPPIVGMEKFSSKLTLRYLFLIHFVVIEEIINV